MLYQTHIRIHLGNIRANLRAIRQALGPDRQLLLAVKANAYGHGAVEVSRMAEAEGIGWLGVATIPEGLELREGGITLPILKLSPAFPEELEAAVTGRLTLAICEPANAEALEAACVACGSTADVQLKIDTGMGRVGVQPLDAPALAAYVEHECPHLRLTGAFTHLPESDEADTTYTQAQLVRFKAAVAEVEATLQRKLDWVHCANSAAVLGHPDSWMALVRPGIMIYGFYPSQGTPRTLPLLPGLSFLTRVSFLKKVKAGTPVGYGLTWTAPEDTWIATIPAGYADGFNRRFSNRGRVLVKGRSYPVVGRVCMDQFMVNLGPETQVAVGDEVVLIGRSGELEITAEEWATALGTITYEVTCFLNARVERVFDTP